MTTKTKKRVATERPRQWPFVEGPHAKHDISKLPGPVVADGANPDSGHLQQTVLVILRFPPEGVPGELTAGDENHIDLNLAQASEFCWTHSRQLLRLQFHRVKFLESLVASDYKNYGAAGYAAKYTSAIHQSLARRDIDPRRYAGVLMLYRPTNASGGLFYNTWIWFNDEISSNEKSPGFSSMFIGNPNVPLWELIVHEYLHQIDHRFEKESGNPDTAQQGFMNPDHMTQPAGQRLAELLGTTFTTPVSYYQAMLAYYVGEDDELHVVNYRWLDGIRGTFYGGELKTVYDFDDPDDRLIHVSGDNITSIQASNPVSFWFRASPGDTAAFRTQTGYGRYLLKQVAFNYEIAPGDYTFRVHLRYVDNRGNPVNVRIDDGLYTLGRQKFRNNRKKINLEQEVEDFQIVFHKGNQLSGSAATDDWLLLGDIKLNADLAP